MSNTDKSLPESDLILTRIDEIRKTLKQFRGFLSDYSSGFENFGKSLSKLSKGLQSSSLVSAKDPNITRKLVLKFSALENAFGRSHGQQFSELYSFLHGLFDEISDRAESSRGKIVDNSNMAIKNLANAKVNYAKMKTKYEKACKEAEAALSEKKKAPKGALKIYSLRNARKLDDLAKSSLNTLLASETSLKEAIEAVNSKQSALSAVSQENFVVFKDLCSTLMEKVSLLMQKGTEALTKVAMSYEGEIDMSDEINEQGSTQLQSSDQEEEYIEERSALADPSMHKEIYRKIVKITEENANNLQEYHLQAFSEAALRHIESNLVVMDERVRLLKAIKAFLNEMSSLYEQLSKLLQKIAKASSLQSSTSPFAKMLSENAAKFYLTAEILSKAYANFPNFINIKGNTIDVIVKELTAGSKGYQAACEKAIKEHIQARTSYLNALLVCDKAAKKLSDLEREKNEKKTTEAKFEYDEIQKYVYELKQTLKITMIEAIFGIRKAHREYRELEFTRIQGVTGALQDFLRYKGNAVNEMKNASKMIETGIKLESGGLSKEIDRLMEQDEKLTAVLNKQLVESLLTFTPLFTPPAEFLQQLKQVDEKEDKIEEKCVEQTGKTYQGSVPKDLEEKFGLGPKDKLIADFSCALKQNILQQGRRDVFDTKLCYGSSLSSEILVIPVADVTAVEKKVNALIFDNAIAIKTINGEIVFASFFARDQAHQVLNQLLKDPKSLLSTEIKKPKVKQIEPSQQIQSEANIITPQKELPSTTDEDASSSDQSKTPTNANRPRGVSETSTSTKYSSNSTSNNSDIIENGEQSDISDNSSSTSKSQEEDLQGPRIANIPVEDATYFDLQNSHRTLQRVVEAKDQVYDTAPLEKLPEFALRKESQYKQIITLDKYPENQVTEVFEDCNVSDVFQAIFSDSAIQYKGKEYATPWFALKTESGDTEISHLQWTPSVPKIFAEGLISDSTLKELREYALISNREYKYIHPLREKNMFAPKTATVEEKHTVYWLSFDEVIVQTEIFLSKVPYSDCFTVKNCFQIKQIEATRVQFTWKGWVDIFKSFMFKGKAYKGSIDEMEDYRKRIFMPLFVENFKALMEKKKETKSQMIQTTTSITQTSEESNGVNALGNSDLQSSINAESEEEEIEVEEEVLVNTNPLTSQNLQLLKERGNKIRSECIPVDKFTTPVFKETFNAGIFEVFNAVFSESSITLSKGASYSSPWDAMRVMQGDTNIESTKFNPPFPMRFSIGDLTEETIQELLNYPSKSERTAKFTHPVREQSMFAPKSCTVIEKTTIYWLSHEEVIVQIQVNTENVPFCDTFVTRVNYLIKQINENQCVMESSMFVDFVKNTMFKGKILKASTDEVIDTGKSKVLALARDLIPFFSKLKPSTERPQTEKVKKIIKRKKQTKISQPTETEPQIVHSNNQKPLEKEKKEDVVQNCPEPKSLADSDKLTAKELKERTMEKSAIVQEIFNKVDSMEESQNELRGELRSLKSIIMVIIGLNIALLAFSALRY